MSAIIRKMKPRRFVRDNGLSIVLALAFLFLLLGQVLSGWRDYNNEQLEHAQPGVGLPRYLTTSHFIEATAENWESEFLQMAAYVLLTVRLFQRGSAESKDPDEPEAVDRDPRTALGKPDAPGPVRKGGASLFFYKYSLSIAFILLFLLSTAMHAYGGARAHSAEEIAHGGHAVSTLEYVKTSRFWFESFQNWQSEFIALLAMVVLSIFLRQHGSPESKPVDAPHSQTGGE